MTHIILASTSVTRRDMLTNVGVRFEARAPAVNEAIIKAGNPQLSPERLAEKLAAAKALAIDAPGQTLVIGADQVLSVSPDILDKPSSISDAAHQLRMLRGQSHRLVSSVSVAREGSIIWQHTNHAELQMRNFSDAFLQHYLLAVGNRALSSVGAYQVEGLGAQLFESIRGDYFTILGLPLLPLLDFLRREGALET